MTNFSNITSRVLSVAAASVLAAFGVTSTASAQFPGWDDHALGSNFISGDFTSSDGVNVWFDIMNYQSGSTGSGTATVNGADAPCTTSQRLNLESLSANWDFAGTIGVQTDLVFISRHEGGELNLKINGSPIVIKGQWADYHGAILDGVQVDVLSGGFSGDCTRILLTGAISKMRIALQEGWVDSPAPCERPTYDDLVLGQVYVTGDTFVTDSIQCRVNPFTHFDGSTFNGDAYVFNAGLSCGDVYEIQTYACAVKHNFSAFLGVNDVTCRVGEYGGSVNMAINGSVVAVRNDWGDLHGAVIGGCTVSVVSGGPQGECTVIEIAGHVDTLTLGGQENAIDCIEWVYEGPPNGGGNACASYDDMSPISAGTEYFVGDTFFTDGILCSVREQFFVAGGSYGGGSAFAHPSTFACGSGQELVTNASAVAHRFAASIGPVENVTVTVADHGGDLNLGINGVLALGNLYSDFDGTTIGGVLVTVVSGGGLNQCTELKFDGQMNNLLLGGGQHFVDCLEYDLVTALPGDLNGDGAVNGADLAILLGAWANSADGDLNGDGNTDGADLVILLGAWTG